MWIGLSSARVARPAVLGAVWVAGACSGGDGLGGSGSAGTESGTDSAATDPGSTSDPSTTGSTTDPSTSTSSATSSTTVPQPVCGNDAVEPPEECDDGNVEPGDGCEPDCTESVDTLLWEVTHAGDAAVAERGEGITTDAAGNVYVIGHEVDTVGDSDIWVRKLDPEGNGVWFSSINPSSGRDDRGYGIDLDSNGNVIVIGTMSTDEVETDIYYAQLDVDGAPVWSLSATGPDPGADGGNDVVVDGNDDLVFVGHVRIGTNDNDIWVRKTDNGGSELWTDIIAGPDMLDDRAQAVTVDADDNIYVVGFVANVGFNNDVWLRKYDPDGEELWTTAHDSELSGSESGYDVAIEADGSVAVVGTTPLVADNDDIWLGRFDGDSGEFLWQRDFGGPAIEHDRAFGLGIDSEGNYLVAGYKGRSDADRDIWLRKWGPTGLVVWTQNIAGAGGGIDEARAVAIDDDDNILVTGEIRNEASTNGDIWIAKFAP